MGRRSSYRREMVLSGLTKQVTIAEACRRHGITETTFALGREQALTGASRGSRIAGAAAAGKRSWSARSPCLSASWGK